MTLEPGLNAEETRTVARAIDTPAMRIVVALIETRLRGATEILYGAPDDRGEHIAIGMHRALQGLMDEIAGAPARAEAEARRSAAQGPSPGGSVYG